MQWLKQSTTVTVQFGPFVAASDGVTPSTGLATNMDNATTGIRVSKNGATMIDRNSATAPAHDDDGYYRIELSTTDTNTLGSLVIQYEESATCLPMWREFMVVPANVWDSFFGADNLQVDMTQIAGVAQAATNLEVVFDGNEAFYTAYQGPRGPGVYLNDAAGNTNVTSGVDGTVSNPVSTVAAANTICDNLSLDRIYLVNDSVVELGPEGWTDFEFIGLGDIDANQINLSGEDVGNSYFENVRITGAQGGTTRFTAKGCVLTGITGCEIVALNCGLTGNITVARDCYFDSCFSAVAGSGTPVLDVNSVANIDLSWRHYSGGLQVNNAVATTVMSFEGNGQLIIDATCTSLTVSIRGNIQLTDNGTTSSITDVARYQRDTHVDAVWDEPMSGHTTAGTAGELLNTPEGSIKKNTAVNDIPILMVDSTDGRSAKTGLVEGSTLTMTVSKDGGAFAAKDGSTTVTESSPANGIYYVDAAAADTNGDFVVWRFEGTGADDVFFSFKTVT